MKFWRQPLDSKSVQVPQGRIYLIKERCKGCAYCVEYCPRDVLKMSGQINAKGYELPVSVREEDCPNCGLCQAICPEYAIYVLDKASEEVARG